ncbi:hypothetical protein [Paenibacillus cymbidii]|uniref:hypothetical protein n=1 Tax=Paenibacillus cymbidii TaxID=1639034 RepID=UPI001081BC93|nr:hypothetical protein [Paenibacillus cymbidii]
MKRYLLALLLALPLLTGIMPAVDSEEQLAPDSQRLPVATSVAAVAAPSAGGTEIAGMEAIIRQSIGTLSALPDFAGWQDAAWDVYPLGPGTHGWVVLLTKQGKEIGYLVISAAEDGQLSLTEYGTGDRPLFSLDTLRQAMTGQEIIAPDMPLAQFMDETVVVKERLYTGALQAVWKVSIGHDSFYYDAKTGDRLPNLGALAAAASGAGGNNDEKTAPGAAVKAENGQNVPIIAVSAASGTFDPYENIGWMDNQDPAISNRHTIGLLLADGAHILYRAKIFQPTVAYALPVTGIHTWTQSNSSYFELDQDGSRFVTAGELFAAGSFVHVD